MTQQQNLPLPEGRTAIVCKDPEIRVSFEGGQEIFRADNGMHVVGYPTAASSFGLEVVRAGSMVYQPRRSAALFESHFHPASIDEDVRSLLDKIPDQHKWYTPGTGGFGRAYVSPASFVLTSQDESIWNLKVRAYRRARAWLVEEIEGRPLSHHPFLHYGDAFSRKTLNEGTPNEWQHQQRNAFGANAFDYAHLYNAHAWSLASVGDPLGVLWFFLIGRWAIPSAYPSVCTNWTTQPRGQGWMLEMAVQMHLLGLFDDIESRQYFSSGFGTFGVLKRWLDMAIDRRWESGVCLGDTRNSIHRGHLGFQLAIRLWGLARVLLGARDRDMKKATRAEVTRELEYFEDRCLDDEGRLSRVVGTIRHEDRTTAQKAANEEQAKSGNAWEVFESDLSWPHPDLGKGWYIREVPRTQDSEMIFAPRAMVDPHRGSDLAAWWMANRDKARWDYDLVTASAVT